MKSIVYLTHPLANHLLPRHVDHPEQFPAFEWYRHKDPRWLSPWEASSKYAGTVPDMLSIHEKINRRAEILGTNYIHFFPLRIGRDYRYPMTAERIARSRYRHFRKLRKQGLWSQYTHGFACIDFSFGLTPRGIYAPCLCQGEREYLAARLQLAASSRAPLPPWRICEFNERDAA